MTIPSFFRWTGVILAFALLSLLIAWIWPHALSGSGGFPLPGELVISVPRFIQSDPLWGHDSLGETPGTLSAEGCAVSSAAMVLGHYGMDIDPGRLNRFLEQHQGYEGAGWLRWESAAEYAPGIAEKAYEGPPDYALIDWNLIQGNPVIVRLRLPDGVTHFVVIVGKRGLDYLIRNPSSSGMGAVQRLSDLGCPIEALRYYRRVGCGIR